MVVAWPLSLCHQRKVLPLLSSVYPKLTDYYFIFVFWKPLPLYEQIQKVLTRLPAVLVISIRAHPSKASLPWAGYQLISTAIIKCWCLPDGQSTCHPWRGCWKHDVSGKPSSADDRIPTANAHLAPVYFVMMCIALLLECFISTWVSQEEVQKRLSVDEQAAWCSSWKCLFFTAELTMLLVLSSST